MVQSSLYVLRSTGLLLLVLGAASGYGALLLVLLKPAQMTRLEGGLFSLGLGLGSLSILVLLVSALGLIYSLVIWSLLALGLGLLIVAGRRLLSLPLGEQTISPMAHNVPQQALRLGLGLIIGLTLGYVLLAHALVPPVDNDVVAYHFAIPKLYIEAHRLIYIPYILHSNWPLSTEMLFLIGLILQSESLAQLISLSFLVILCLAVVLFGNRWLHFQAGWVATAILCSIPMMLSLSGSGMVEVPLTCYTFLSFYALWRWYEHESRGWLITSALLAGFAAATKLNGASAAIVFALAAFCLLLLSRRPMMALRVFTIYGAISLLIVLPWYIKSWIHTGNPIWPFLYAVLGGRNWDNLGSTYLHDYLQVTNMQPTFINWLTGLWQVTIANGRFGGFLLGPYLLTLLPIGLLPMIFNRDLRPLLVVLGLITLACYTVWFLLTHQTRFLAPMLPFALLFGATGITWLWQRGPRLWRAGLQVGLVAWLLCGAWLFNPQYQYVWQRSLPYLLGQVDRAVFISNVYPEYPMFSYINQQLPPTSRLLLAPFEVHGYYLDRSYIWANMISQRYLRLEQVPDVDTLYATLRKLHVTHVLISPTSAFKEIAYREHIDMLLSDLVSRHGRLLHEVGQVRVYELVDGI